MLLRGTEFILIMQYENMAVNKTVKMLDSNVSFVHIMQCVLRQYFQSNYVSVQLFCFMLQNNNPPDILCSLVFIVCLD